MSVHRLDTDNLGDRLCSPALYFDFLGSSARHDLLRVPSRVKRHARVIVVGGGGLLDNDYYLDGWHALVNDTGAELIAWGLGHNRRGGSAARYPDFLSGFSLVGVRDTGPGIPATFEWVPCASCMHAAFDQSYGLESDVVCYSHAAHPLAIDGVPRLTNSERDVSKVMRFLASAETVVTNTYHGMYWATLLGRKVVVCPYSSKFHGFRYPVVMSTPDDWKAARRLATSSPQALNECRDANRRFAEKVRQKVLALRA